MIWFSLALFAASFILTALLAPKPDIENARPEQFDDSNFPRASEDAPIPLILGKVLMDAPNTIWYGNFQAIPIYEKIKVGLFKSITSISGHYYKISLDLALALGPGVVMKEIQMDDKVLWSGSVSKTDVTLINIDAPSHFGGYKSGGGFVGGGRYYPGSFTQPVNGHVESFVGFGNVPAYRGVAHIVFENVNIGEQAQLRKTAFVLECYTNDLGGLPDDALIGEDMNPAEALYQIFTSEWRGAKTSTDLIDLVALRELGNTCYDEGNGVSIKVTADSTAGKVVKEIMRQIDAIGYQDPATGKIVFKLIRKDYNVATLPIFDEEDIAEMQDFTRTSWQEVISSVKVSFPQRDKDSQAVAESHDMAIAGMVGRMKTSKVSMPFCYDPNTANKIASRERSQLSVPLISSTIRMLRSANTLRPGSVFKMNWPEYNLANIVMRVQEFDLGSLLDGRIVIKVLEDSYAVDTVVFAPPSGSAWVPPETTPVDIEEAILVETPVFFQRKLQEPTAEGFTNFLPLPVPPTPGSTAFDMAASEISGAYSIRDLTYASFPQSALLTTDYSRTAGFPLGLDSSTGFTVDGPLTAASGISELEEGEVGILYVGGEWMGFTSITDNEDGTFTLNNIYRGLFGSRPRDHSIDDRVYQPIPQLFGSGFRNDIDGDATIYAVLMNRVGPNVQDPTEVDEESLALNQLNDRPLRPRNLKLDDERIAFLTGTTDVSLTFARSSKDQEEVTFETDADQTPEETEVYDVEVWVDDVMDTDLSSDDNASSPITLDISTYSIASTNNAEVRVYSKRVSDDLRSADYAVIPFKVNNTQILLSGDMQSGSDVLLLSGDASDGDDAPLISGDEI